MHWRAHPLRQRPRKAIIASLILLAIATAVFVSFGAIWAAAALLVLLWSLNRFFLPSRFAVDDEGITAHYPLRRQRALWRDLHRFVHDDNGGYLSTRSRASRLDAYTGMHLLFPADRQPIIDFIHGKIREAQADQARSTIAGDMPPPSQSRHSVIADGGT